MKKSIQKTMLALTVIYGVGSTLYFGSAYVKQKEVIGTQVQQIQEQEELIAKGTDEVTNLQIKSEELEKEIASLRQEQLDIERQISSTEGEIRDHETRLENLRVSRGGLPTVNGRVIKVKVTGYCPCALCCGQWAYKNPGITASGTVAKFGTVAAPKSIPFGTKMYIEGYGDKVFTVEDTGSAVVYKNGVYVIDMWMPTHAQAYAVGNKTVEAIILN